MLEVLARSEGGRGVGDIAQHFSLPKSNAHRTLSTLVKAGYVVQNSNGKYECTLKLFELGSHITDRIDVRSKAEESMESLSNQTREAVHLAILEDKDVIYLHKIESPEPIRAYSRVGGRAPAYSVASGKALLAYQPETYLDQFPDSLVGYTPKTIVSKSTLEIELKSIRKNHVSVNTGEWHPDVGGIGAIVFDHQNTPIAAVGVSGPLQRVQDNLENNAAAVISAARKISASLGCRNYMQTITDWEGSA